MKAADSLLYLRGSASPGPTLASDLPLLVLLDSSTIYSWSAVKAASTLWKILAFPPGVFSYQAGLRPLEALWPQRAAPPFARDQEPERRPPGHSAAKPTCPFILLTESLLPAGLL